MSRPTIKEFMGGGNPKKYTMKIIEERIIQKAFELEHRLKSQKEIKPSNDE